jgi:hypothetical protein
LLIFQPQGLYFRLFSAPTCPRGDIFLPRGDETRVRIRIGNRSASETLPKIYLILSLYDLLALDGRTAEELHP